MSVSHLSGPLIVNSGIYGADGTGGGEHWFVDAAAANLDGKDWDGAFTTIQKAVDQASAGDTIHVAPKAAGYDETITVLFAKNNLTIIGEGNRGAVFIITATAGAEGMEVRANDVTLINVGVEAEDTADYALRVFGSRFRAYGCKFEGPTANVVRVGPGTIAQTTAPITHGRGGDILFYDCEFAWGGTGIVVTSSNFGACTQLRVYRCHFHNLTVACVGENDVGVIGAGRNIWLDECIFDVGEDGAVPTDFIDLDSVGTTGRIYKCTFATTVHASALIQIAAGILYLGNQTQAEGPATGGGTAGRPD